MVLTPVDRLEVLVLVDNATDMLSSTPSNVENEAAGLMRRGIRMVASKCLCCAAHGLSCLTASFGAPTSLRPLGMPETGIDRAADLAMKNAFWNPRPLERDAIRDLIARAFAGEPPPARPR
jgi:hypothetical protein